MHVHGRWGAAHVTASYATSSGKGRHILGCFWWKETQNKYSVSGRGRRWLPRLLNQLSPAGLKQRASVYQFRGLGVRGWLRPRLQGTTGPGLPLRASDVPLPVLYMNICHLGQGHRKAGRSHRRSDNSIISAEPPWPSLRAWLGARGEPEVLLVKGSLQAELDPGHSQQEATVG